MQNHLDISLKIKFWTRSVRNWTNSRNMEGKPSGKHIFLMHFSKTDVTFGLQTAFFDGFNVLMSFLAEK